MVILVGCATFDPDTPLLEGDHTLKIRLWDVKEGGTTRLLQRVPGRQSRDIGQLIRDEAGRCIRDPRTPCEVVAHRGEFTFTVEFRHLAFALVPGSRIARNGVSEPVPDGFGKWRSTIAVEVKDGVGTLTIPASWVTPETVMLIHTPWPRGSLHYPSSGILRTYGPHENADGDEGELYRLVREEQGRDGVTNYHFAR